MNAVPAAAQPQPVKESKPFLLRCFFSLAWGTLAIVVGAVIWGLVAYFSNSIYIFIAFFLGLAVAAAILLPLSPIHKAVALIFLPVALAGTLLSILLGESLFAVLGLMRDYEATVPEALTAVVEGMSDILSARDTLGSLAVGGIGGLIGFFYAWKDL
jgi:hypothetical protein